LYIEGPVDKTITFLAVENYRSRAPIPAGFENIPDIAFLSGHSLNELITAERIATEYALASAGRPNMTITLDEVNANTIGQLLYFFEVQTAFTGALLDINAFDQPGVEMGKNATYALLGKKGYDEKRTELDARPTKNPRYII
jgi:glucose-6-phosphate isomerase